LDTEKINQSQSESQSSESKERRTPAGRRIYDFGQPYVPELDYISTDYDTFGRHDDLSGGFDSHFCQRCVNYYHDIKCAGITKKDFPPECQGDISENIRALLASGKCNDEDAEILLLEDPITFAAEEFNWKPRWYQLEMLRCTAQKKVVRAGRRLGKSVAMAVKILHLLYTNKNYNILLVCPYQSQVKRVFQIIHNDLLDQAISFRECITKDHESPPMTIALANGSAITGFSSGAKSGGKSTQIRGQDAHAIFMDEMDYLSEEDFEAVLAILASHPDCLLWASSTPTGARNQFFEDCTNKDLGYKEFHYISAESPSWRQSTEDHLREKYSESSFAREFYAEFGDETYGVFRNSDVNASIVDYRYSSCSYDTNIRYIMGVDWNETHGVHIVVVGCGRFGKDEVLYKVVGKEIIERQELTQHKAVQRIIELDRIWHTDYIYCDAGFGTTQIEMLHKYGKQNPYSKLHKKTKAYAMQSKITIKDPSDNSDIQKQAKTCMVGIAMRQVEMGRCILPKSEDTNAAIDEEGTQGESIGLIQQMRAFKIEKYSKYGDPTYSQGYEHTLTAWMLALTGFVLEMGDLRRVSYDLGVWFSGPMGEGGSLQKDRVNKDTVAEDTKKLKKRLMPPSRVLKSTMFKTHSVRRGILNDRRTQKMDHKVRQDEGFIKQPKRLGRKTF